jgi:hypothetical protein
MNIRRIALAVTAAALALSACGSKTTTGSGRPDTTGSTGVAKTSGGTDAVNQDVPKFGGDYERTCADGIGFGGVPEYARTPKVLHPAVLLTKEGSDLWVQQVPTSDFPNGWFVSYNGDFGKAQLVVCYERTRTIATGRKCEMSDSKTKQPFTLELYNTQYRLRILEARTGRAVYAKTGLASRTDCPTITFTSGDDDRTKYYTDLQPRDYRGALKPYINP